GRRIPRQCRRRGQGQDDQVHRGGGGSLGVRCYGLSASRLKRAVLPRRLRAESRHMRYLAWAVVVAMGVAGAGCQSTADVKPEARALAAADGDTALAGLMEGNRRFAAGAPVHPRQTPDRRGGGGRGGGAG